MITIPKQKYEELKMQANIDVELVQDLMRGIRDIKEGKVRRVK